jgi:sugar lactone lactonase YvrE
VFLDVRMAIAKTNAKAITMYLMRRSTSQALPTGYAVTRRGVFGALWAGVIRKRTACAATRGKLGKIHIPETVANLCFGGQQRNRLYICGSTSLYAVYTSVQGAMKP